MRDSYINFFSECHISKEDFFDFGLKETIYAPYCDAEKQWCQLKYNIQNNKEVFIRGFGSGGNSTVLYEEFYKKFLGNSKVKKDSTNNAEPTKIIKELTGYSKNSKGKNSKFKRIRNYQVSHIFGRTKNVYSFTAPWNIVYMPKILDPFTGHEAKGEMIDEYISLFQKTSYKRFSNLIDDFNKIMTDEKFIENIETSINALHKNPSFNEKDIEKLKKSVSQEFMPIEVQA